MMRGSIDTNCLDLIINYYLIIIIIILLFNEKSQFNS